MNFEGQIMVPTHRLVDADARDNCPSVVELISAKRYPFYLVEIKADGFMVHGGNIVPEKKEKVSVDEKPKSDKKFKGIGRK